MFTFHPWGKIEWILKQFDRTKWDILGCISPEERSIGVIEYFSKKNIEISNNYFLQINDPPSEFSEQIRKKVIDRVGQYDKLIPLGKGNIHMTELLSTNSIIVDHLNSFLKHSSENVIIDISSLPKRFFFPFIKLLLKNESIKNLLVTYTTAQKYDEGDLADDPEPWNHLPLFGPIEFPEKKPKHAVVGIGFIPFGLSKLIRGKYQDTPVSFFFPFPPGPPHVHRSWEFLRLIEKSYNISNNDNVIRVNSIDVSDSFNHIKVLSNYGKDDIILAPYGPKPISLSFAIFASLSGSPVYYTQPKKYSPNYSSGISNIYAYCLKHRGNLIYKIHE